MFRASRLAIHCANRSLPVRFRQVSSLIHPLTSDQTITEGPSWVTITPPYITRSPRQLSRQLRAKGQHSKAHSVLRKAGVLHSYSEHDLIELLLVLRDTDEFSGPHDRLNAMMDALWTIPTHKPKRAFRILLSTCNLEATRITDNAIVKLASVKSTAEIIWREMRQSGTYIDPSLTAMMYHICGYCRALDLARQVRDDTKDPVIDSNFPKPSSEAALAAYILCLGKCGHPIDAERLFFAHQNRSLQNSPQVLRALFNAYLSASRVSKAEFLISRHGSFFLDYHGCNSFIRQCIGARLFETAFSFLDKMERFTETGFPAPDASTYNFVLHGLSVARPGIGKSFVNTARDIIIRMKDRNIKPTVFTYNALIRSYIMRRQNNEAMNLFRSMETFDAITLSYLMQGAANIGDANIASQLLTALKSTSLRPTYGFCKSYLHIMGFNYGADYALEEARSLIRSFEDVISFGDVGSEESIRMALIYACGKAGDLPAAFRAVNARISEKYNEKGLFAPLYVATVLMQACLDCGREGQALEVFESLKSASKSQPNLQPNSEVFESLIKGLCVFIRDHASQRNHVVSRSNHEDDVADNLSDGGSDNDDDDGDEGGEVNMSTFAPDRNQKAAVELSGLKGISSEFNHQAVVSVREKDLSAILGQTLHLVREMHECGAAQTSRRASLVYDMIIRAASAIGQFDLAFEIFRRMTRHSNFKVLYVVSPADTNKKLHEADDVNRSRRWPELPGCNELPQATVHTYNATMEAALCCSREQDALMIFNRMRMDPEIRPNEGTMNLLSEIGLGSDEPSVVQAVLVELDRCQVSKRVAKNRILLRQKLLAFRWSS